MSRVEAEQLGRIRLGLNAHCKTVKNGFQCLTELYSLVLLISNWQVVSEGKEARIVVYH